MEAMHVNVEEASEERGITREEHIRQQKKSGKSVGKNK